MVDPVSAMCAAAMTKIVATTMNVETITSGIVGNTADKIFSNLFVRTVDKFIKNARLPQNHDLLKGLLKSYRKSLLYTSITISQQCRNIIDRTISDKISDFVKQEISIDSSNIKTMSTYVTPIISATKSESGSQWREDNLKLAIDNTVIWIEENINEKIPDHLRLCFSETSPNGRGAWHTVFQLYLAEEIKTNERYERIFVSSNVSNLVGRAIKIEELSHELSKGLDDLKLKLNDISDNLSQIKDSNYQISSKVDRILSIFESTPEAKSAISHNIDRHVFVDIATPISKQSSSDLDAIEKLRATVIELVKLKENDTLNSKIDDLAITALHKTIKFSIQDEIGRATKIITHSVDNKISNLSNKNSNFSVFYLITSIIFLIFSYPSLEIVYKFHIHPDTISFCSVMYVCTTNYEYYHETIGTHILTGLALFVIGIFIGKKHAMNAIKHLMI